MDFLPSFGLLAEPEKILVDHVNVKPYSLLGINLIIENVLSLTHANHAGLGRRVADISHTRKSCHVVAHNLATCFNSIVDVIKTHHAKYTCVQILHAWK